MVFTLSSGEKLVSILETEEPDIVVLDLHLRGEDGFELIKKISKEIPVIAFAAILDAEMEKRAFKAGACEMLSKTGNLEDLKRKINKILSNPGPSLRNQHTVRDEKILIVDDEENIRALLKTFLEYKGFHPLIAASGEEALEIVRKDHPQMILLDVMMPGMGGMLTLKKIREIDPQAGIVMATGLQDEGNIREASRLGAYASVFKPFDMKYLELVVLTRLLMAC